MIVLVYLQLQILGPFRQAEKNRALSKKADKLWLYHTCSVCFSELYRKGPRSCDWCSKCIPLYSLQSQIFGPLRKQKHAISSICTEKHEEFRIILLCKQGSYFEFLKCLVDLHIAFNTNICRKHNYIFFNRCVKTQKYCKNRLTFA